MGNVWHWCEDWFSALPNSFGSHPLYEDFSTPCYDGQHSIVLGGSFMSTGGEASRYARFHFRPHFHQHAGFRLARSNAPPRLSHVDSPPPHAGLWNPSTRKAPSVASATALGRALLTHYAAQPLTEPLASVFLNSTALNFPACAAALLSAAAREHGAQTAAVLDVGCGVGGLSFALAEVFDAVLAIDLSAECIAAALDVQANGSTTASVKVEGNIFESKAVAIRVPATASARVTFRQMDPCSMSSEIGTFDAVVVNNMLDQCVSPKAPLMRLGGVNGIVHRGGLVFVLSGYNWDPEKSDASVWLGGRPGAGPSADGIAAALGPDFDLRSQARLPLVHREDSRRFTLQLMEALVFQRKPEASA